MVKIEIAIIYGVRFPGSGPELGETMLADGLRRRGAAVNFHNAESPLIDGRCRIYLNRVYPSVANENPRAVGAALALCRRLEEQGCQVINRTSASENDYDKLAQYHALLPGVAVPETMAIESEHALTEFIKHHTGVVVKPRTGGRGHNVRLIHSPDIGRDGLASIPFDGSHVAQAFVRSAENYDVRLCVYGGKVIHAHGRSLIATGDSSEQLRWLGSISRGSQFVEYKPTKVEVELAVRATSALGAEVNEVDMVIGENGPVVIENNLTPNYDDRTADLVELFCDTMIDKIR